MCVDNHVETILYTYILYYTHTHTYTKIVCGNVMLKIRRKKIHLRNLSLSHSLTHLFFLLTHTKKNVPFFYNRNFLCLQLFNHKSNSNNNYNDETFCVIYLNTQNAAVVGISKHNRENNTIKSKKKKSPRITIKKKKKLRKICLRILFNLFLLLLLCINSSRQILLMSSFICLFQFIFIHCVFASLLFDCIRMYVRVSSIFQLVFIFFLLFCMHSVCNTNFHFLGNCL